MEFLQEAATLIVLLPFFQSFFVFHSIWFRLSLPTTAGRVISQSANNWDSFCHQAMLMMSILWDIPRRHFYSDEELQRVNLRFDWHFMFVSEAWFDDHCLLEISLRQLWIRIDEHIVKLQFNFSILSDLCESFAMEGQNSQVCRWWINRSPFHPTCCWLLFSGFVVCESEVQEFK